MSKREREVRLLRDVLCVGGKHAGRWVKVHDDTPDVRLVDPPPVNLVAEPFKPMDQKMNITTSVYVLTRFDVNGKTYWLGCQEGLTVEEMFEDLLHGYRP